MNKFNKLLLNIGILSSLPTLVCLTSCNKLDFSKVKEYFNQAYALAKQAFIDSPTYTDSIFKGLEQTYEVEYALVDSSINKYWTASIINLRQEAYNTTKWNLLYGDSGKERNNIFLPLKEQLQLENKWITVGQNITDYLGNNIDYYHLIATYNAWVKDKSSDLKDLAGWGGDLVTAAADLKAGHSEMPSFGDSDLYADVDACNIGLIFNDWKDEYKSSSLAMYQYYTNLLTDANRFESFYTKVWGLDKSSSSEDKVNKIMSRLSSNLTLQTFITTQGLSWSGDKAYFQQAVLKTIERVEAKL